MVRYHLFLHDLRIIFGIIETVDFAFVIARPGFFVVGKKSLEDVFPFAQTIFFDIVVESRRLRKALVSPEGLRTKEVLACGPNHQPCLEILFVMIEESMRAIENCLQRHLSTTSLIRHMYIRYSMSTKHEYYTHLTNL